jgi:ERF superfamily
MEMQVQPNPQTVIPPGSNQSNLYQRFLRVVAGVEVLPKRGRNEALDYSFITEADVITVVRPRLLQERLLFLPSLKVWQVDPASGNAYVVMTFRLINVDNPSEFFDIDMIGSGCDRTQSGLMGDKAIYKSLTGCQKYALLKSCMIATSDDPEFARAEEFRRTQQHTQAQAEIETILSGVKVQPQQVPQPIAQQVGQQQVGQASALGSAIQVTSAVNTPPQLNGAPWQPVPNNWQPTGTEFAPIEPPQREAGEATEADIQRLLKQSAMQEANQFQQPVQTPTESPEVIWARDMRRKAEDSRSSDEVIQLWNGNKELFRKLQMANPNIYRELHETFKTKRDYLRANRS